MWSLSCLQDRGTIESDQYPGEPQTQQNFEGYRSAGSQSTMEETSGNIVGLDVCVESIRIYCT